MTENEQSIDDDNVHENRKIKESIHTVYYNECCNTGLNYLFPTLYIALTLSITKASSKRPFYILKLIKFRNSSVLAILLI